MSGSAPFPIDESSRRRRAAHVERIRSAIATGDYHVPSEQVADAVLRTWAGVVRRRS